MVLWGAAAATLAIGGLEGYRARERWQEAKDACEMAPDVCTPRAVTLGVEARNMANWSTWLVTGGAVLAASGVHLWWTTRARPAAGAATGAGARDSSPSRARIVPTIAPDAVGAVVYTQF